VPHQRIILWTSLTILLFPVLTWNLVPIALLGIEIIGWYQNHGHPTWQE
jgi:hypothetical protein